MRQLGGLINTYRMAWIVLVIILVGLTWWWLYFYQAPPMYSSVDHSEIKQSGVNLPNPPAQSLEERTRLLSLEVSGAEMTLSSNDGTLLMHIWADAFTKNEGIYAMNSGIIQFTLETHDVLLVQLTDASFSTFDGIVRVKGNLKGQMMGTGQYFSADELTWDQSTSEVTAKRVVLIGDQGMVEGSSIILEMQTGRLTYEGPVRARF